VKNLILIVALVTQTLYAQAMAETNPKLLLFCNFRTPMGMAFLEIYSHGNNKSVELSLMGESLLPPQLLNKSANNGRFKKFISDSVYLTLDETTAAEAPMGNTELRGLLSIELPELALNNQQVKCEIKQLKESL